MLTRVSLQPGWDGARFSCWDMGSGGISRKYIYLCRYPGRANKVCLNFVDMAFVLVGFVEGMIWKG